MFTCALIFLALFQCSSNTAGASLSECTGYFRRWHHQFESGRAGRANGKRAKKNFTAITILKIHLCGPLHLHGPFYLYETFCFHVALLHLGLYIGPFSAIWALSRPRPPLGVVKRKTTPWGGLGRLCRLQYFNASKSKCINCCSVYRRRINSGFYLDVRFTIGGSTLRP